MKRQSGLLVGSTLILASSLINFIARFATSILVARSLGPQGKGVYNLTLLVGSLLVLFMNLGIGGSLTYLIASKQFKLEDIFSYGFWMALFCGILGGIVFYFPYKFFLVRNLLAGTQERQIVWVLVILPIIILTSYISSMLLGEQKILAFNLVSISQAILNFLFQLTASILTAGVSGAIIAWISANIGAFAVALFLLRKSLSLKTNHLKKILRPSISFGIRSYVANLLAFFNYRFDSLLVNNFLGPASVGLYQTGVGVAELIWYIPNAVSSALFPKVSTISPDTASQVTSRACRQVLLITTIAAVGLGLSGIYLIPFVYGTKFAPSVIPFLWLLPGIIGITISKVIYADLSGRGKPQYATISSVVTIILTVVLDLILIPLQGIKGAAIASSIVYLSSAILAILWFTRETHTNWRMVIIPTLSDVRYLLDKGKSIIIQVAKSPLSSKRSI